MKLIQLILLPAMAAFMLASCGQQKATQSTADTTAVAPAIHIDNPVTECTYTDTDGKDLGITARIENGNVFVTVNEQKVLALRYGSFRLPNATARVQNLDQPVLSLFIADIGQDYNPVLCMIRQDGRVQILSLFDAIYGDGQMYASYPLPGLSGITSFASASFEDYMGINALSADSTATEVPYNPVLCCAYTYDESPTVTHLLRLTSDWKIIYRKTILRDGIVDQMEESVGEYTSRFEGGEIDNNIITYQFHTQADIVADDSAPQTTDHHGTFSFVYGTTPKTVDFMLKSGEGIGLPRGKKVQFKRMED